MKHARRCGPKRKKDDVDGVADQSPGKVRPGDHSKGRSLPEDIVISRFTLMRYGEVVRKKRLA